MRIRAIQTGTTGIAIFFIASGALWLPAAAQGRSETYRCGNTYTDRPCEGGKPVKVDDVRSEADRRASEAGTQKAEVRADQLERMGGPAGVVVTALWLGWPLFSYFI